MIDKGDFYLKIVFFCLFLGFFYYDNVRFFFYLDLDVVLICFDISRLEILDSVLKKVSVGE